MLRSESLEDRRLLSVTALFPGQTPADNERSSLGTLALGKHRAVSGSVGGNDHSDSFNFTLTQPTQVTLSLGDLAKNAGITLVRTGRKHKVIAAATATLEAGNLIRSLDPGTYSVGISTVHGAATGYTLTVATSAAAAPSRLEAQAWGGNSVHLNWNDNTTGETGYLIQRYTHVGWRSATSAPANATAAVIDGLTPGASTTYRVLATGMPAAAQPGHRTLSSLSGVSLASTSTAGATTGDTDTTGWYKVSLTGGMTQAYAGWQTQDDGLSILPQYDDQWLYAGSWQAAVFTAINGQAQVYVTNRSGGHSPGDIVTHNFPTGGDFKVGTGAEIYADGGVQDFKLPHTGDEGNAKFITLEDSYGAIDRDYDDFYWTVHTEYKLGLSVTASDASAGEAGGDPGDVDNGSFTITRTGDTTEALDVTYSITGTATQGNDFTLGGGSIQDATIAAGQSSVTVTVKPKKDNRVEETETVVIAISDTTSGPMVDPDHTDATVSISDDPPVVTLTKVQDGSEDPDSSTNYTTPKPVKFEVARSGGDTSGSINVNYGVTGYGDHGASADDYTAANTVSVDARAIISLGVTDDSTIEYREGLLLTLSNGGGTYQLAMDNANIREQKASAEISDNDFSIKGVAISFGDQGVARDSGTQLAYGGDQWNDFDGDGQTNVHGANPQDSGNGYPISFERSDAASTRYIAAAVAIVIEYKDSNVLGGSLSIFGLGSGTGGGFFGSTTSSSVGAGTAQPDGSQRSIISATEVSQTALPSTIDTGILSVDWTLGRTILTEGPAKVIIKSPGTSKNRVYVTGGAASNAFETVLDIGCSAATGKRPGNPGEEANAASAKTSDVLTSIFDNKFKSLNLRDVEGNLLTYWGSQYGLGKNWPAAGDGTKTLLKYQDGRCGDWAAFLQDVVRAQGVEGVGTDDIERVSFHGSVPANPDPAKDVAGFFTPAKAQGDAVPTEKWFTDHSVDIFVPADGKSCILLDPSYGVRFTGNGFSISPSVKAAEIAWSSASIAAGDKGDWVKLDGTATVISPFDGSSSQAATGYSQASALFDMQTSDFIWQWDIQNP